MARKSGLGKGLDAIIPGDFTPQPATGEPTEAPIGKIIPNPQQPRYVMDEDQLQELADSIREHGIIQPLVVSQDPDSDRYILIAGERRLRAARIAGLQTVPIVLRSADKQERLELALIENVQRADLSPLETAEAYRQLAEDFHLSKEEIATQVGKNRTTVTNTMRLLELPEMVRQALADGDLTEGHARAIQGLNHPAQQIQAMKTVIDGGLNVRQTEALVRRMLSEKPAHPAKAPSPEVLEIEERLRSCLGTRVTLNHGKKGGSLTIHYYSEEELDSLLHQILRD